MYISSAYIVVGNENSINSERFNLRFTNIQTNSCRYMINIEGVQIYIDFGKRIGQRLYRGKINHVFYITIEGCSGIKVVGIREEYDFPVAWLSWSARAARKDAAVRVRTCDRANDIHGRITYVGWNARTWSRRECSMAWDSSPEDLRCNVSWNAACKSY